MTLSSFPWEQINTPLTEINRRRVDEKHPHSFFWGKDSTGNCLLLLTFEQDVLDHLEIKKVEFTGIETDLRINPMTTEAILVIILKTNENSDIFYTLCLDLIEKTKTIIDTVSALKVIYARLERWRTFLSKTKKNILSPEEIQGLFAELSFLEECINKHSITKNAALEAWKGPLGGAQDFVFGTSSIEIKSIAGTHKDFIHITSENQLTNYTECLYLKVFVLSADLAAKTGISLNEKIKQLKILFIDSDCNQIFESRLSDAGYIDIQEYDTPRFLIKKIIIYEVKEGFPCITTRGIPKGVGGVNYKIHLEFLDNYICNSICFGGK